MIKEDYENIIEKIDSKYPSVTISDIYGGEGQGGDAPTETGDEIVVELYPTNPMEYKNGITTNKQYMKECHQMFNDINNQLKNKCQHDISKYNNWAYIYIIL